MAEADTEINFSDISNETDIYSVKKICVEIIFADG